jgi:iron complex outermembrane receptor protein
MPRSKPKLALSGVILGLLWGNPTWATDPPPPPPPPPPTPVVPEGVAGSAGAAGKKASRIEDTPLESLLDMNLEDKLGTTEAVSRTNESILRAPATVTTLDSTQVRLSGASTVPDVLRFVPGVAVYQSSPGNYVVALRGTGGLSGNNIILLVDGIPINNVVDGSVSFDLIPVQVEDIERIEVVRGPVSPTYGANAYTGVINIVTRTTVGLTPSYVARVRGGVDLDGKPKGSLSGRFIHIGKKLQFKWFLDAEHDATSAKPATPNTPAHEIAGAANRFASTASLSWARTTTTHLSAQVGAATSKRSSMEHLVLDSVPQDQRLLFGRVLYEVNELGPLSVKLWTHGLFSQIDAEEDDQTGLSYNGTRSMRGTAGTDLVLALPMSVSALFGGQGSLERIDAPYIHPNANGSVRPAYGFYGGIKAIPTAALDLIVTGRGDLAPISAKIEYSYRASAIYHTDTWALRLTGASAFRAPTYVEAVGRFIDPTGGLILLEGSDSIGAPRNTSVELGATFSPYTTLTISPTIYVSRLSNLMVEDFESLVRRSYRNDPSSVTYAGGEFEANWRVTDAVSLLPSLSVLHWLDTPARIATNIGSPDQNSRVTAGLRLQGLFGNDRWGYGIGAVIASARTYNVRVGIPTITLSKHIPTNAYLSANLERQLSILPAIWASVRVSASVPRGQPESPLPLAAPLGQSAVLGLEIRRD